MARKANENMPSVTSPRRPPKASSRPPRIRQASPPRTAVRTTAFVASARRRCGSRPPRLTIDCSTPSSAIVDVSPATVVSSAMSPRATAPRNRAVMMTLTSDMTETATLLAKTAATDFANRGRCVLTVGGAAKAERA